MVLRVSSRRSFFSGLFMIIAGTFFTVFSIRPTLGFMQLYFYWSFTYVDPMSRLNLIPGRFYSLPAIVRTYEVLLPWLLIGIALLAAGIFLTVRILRKRSSVSQAGAS